MRTAYHSPSVRKDSVIPGKYTSCARARGASPSRNYSRDRIFPSHFRRRRICSRTTSWTFSRGWILKKGQEGRSESVSSAGEKLASRLKRTRRAYARNRLFGSPFPGTGSGPGIKKRQPKSFAEKAPPSIRANAFYRRSLFPRCEEATEDGTKEAGF